MQTRGNQGNNLARHLSLLKMYLPATGMMQYFSSNRYVFDECALVDNLHFLFYNPLF